MDAFARTLTASKSIHEWRTLLLYLVELVDIVPCVHFIYHCMAASLLRSRIE